MPITHWHWFAAAVLFVVLEMVLPGVVFLWLGVAAAVTGFGLLALPGIGPEAQLLVFSVLSVVSVVVGRLWVVRGRLSETDHPTLNRRGEQYVGRRLTLSEPIINGVGKVKVDDTTWKVLGDDASAGGTVLVTGVDGTMLRVEKAVDRAPAP